MNYERDKQDYWNSVSADGRQYGNWFPVSGADVVTATYLFPSGGSGELKIEASNFDDHLDYQDFPAPAVTDPDATGGGWTLHHVGVKFLRLVWTPRGPNAGGTIRASIRAVGY